MKTDATNPEVAAEMLRMAAMARMVRDGAMPAVDSKGKRLPVRYWVALAAVEARTAAS